MENDIPKKM